MTSPQGRRGLGRGAFTLVEMLVVIAIIGVLATSLLLATQQGIASAHRAACAQNLRQLYLANLQHATETGAYAPAASDLFGSNRERWHGSRSHASDPFDAAEGPLAPYLGTAGAVRKCPAFRNPVRTEEANAFEASCGGYGYNATGVGSLIYELGMCAEALKTGMPLESIRDPSHTVMFTDCAFPQPYGGNPHYLIEYSFAEAYHWVFEAGRETEYRADPSIHFRHRSRANVVWCDGHISAERLETRAEPHFSAWRIGWFGPADNSLFDP